MDRECEMKVRYTGCAAWPNDEFAPVRLTTTHYLTGGRGPVPAREPVERQHAGSPGPAR